MGGLWNAKPQRERQLQTAKLLSKLVSLDEISIENWRLPTTFTLPFSIVQSAQCCIATYYCLVGSALLPDSEGMHAPVIPTCSSTRSLELVLLQTSKFWKAIHIRNEWHYRQLCIVVSNIRPLMRSACLRLLTTMPSCLWCHSFRICINFQNLCNILESCSLDCFTQGLYHHKVVSITSCPIGFN